MSYVRRTMIVPADHVEFARSLAAHLEPIVASNMFPAPLSPTGDEPATHYVSSGAIGEQFDVLLADPVALHAVAPSGTALADCEALVAASIVVDLADETAHETFARVGLKLVSEDPDPG